MQQCVSLDNGKARMYASTYMISGEGGCMIRVAIISVGANPSRLWEIEVALLIV